MDLVDPVDAADDVKREARRSEEQRGASSSTDNASRRVARWRWLLPVAALVVAFHVSGLGPAIDRAFFDAASRRPWREPALDTSASAIVVIDEHTLALGKQEGYGARWPFPRFAFAGLIASLHRAGAERIVNSSGFTGSSSSSHVNGVETPANPLALAL